MPAVSLQYSNMNNAEAFNKLLHTPIDFNLSGENVLISGVRALRIYVYRLFLIVGGDTNLIFQDGLDNDLTGPLPMLSNGSLAFDISNVPWFQTASGNDFILNSSSGVQVSGAIYYQQD